MGQFRDIPIPPNAQHVRLQLAGEDVDALAMLGVKARLSVAAVCRVAMTLIARGGTANEETILAEVTRIRAERQAEKEPEEQPRPRGRPKKEKPAEQSPSKPRGRPRKTQPPESKRTRKKKES